MIDDHWWSLSVLGGRGFSAETSSRHRRSKARQGPPTTTAQTEQKNEVAPSAPGVNRPPSLVLRFVTRPPSCATAAAAVAAVRSFFIGSSSHLSRTLFRGDGTEEHSRRWDVARHEHGCAWATAGTKYRPMTANKKGVGRQRRTFCRRRLETTKKTEGSMWRISKRQWSYGEKSSFWPHFQRRGQVYVFCRRYIWKNCQSACSVRAQQQQATTQDARSKAKRLRI